MNTTYILHIFQLGMMVLSLTYFYYRIYNLEKDKIQYLVDRIKHLEELVNVQKKKVSNTKELVSRSKELMDKNKEIMTSLSNQSRINKETINKQEK